MYLLTRIVFLLSSGDSRYVNNNESSLILGKKIHSLND